MTSEEMASKIVHEGIPLLSKGGGEAVELKLKYCPVCGSYVKLNYGNGVYYYAISWHCKNDQCEMSKQDKPLDGWNERNEPSSAIIMEAM